MLGTGSHLRLGELLMDAGILSQEKISAAVYIAQEQRVPVGRALIMCGFLTETVLQAAIQAQSAFRDRLISIEDCRDALKIVNNEDITLDQALSKLGWRKDKQVLTNRLGELLVEAEVLSPHEAEDYVDRSKQSGLPLGRLLATIGIVPETLIMSALTVQVLIREGKVNRQEAIVALKAARERQVPVDQTLQTAGSPGSITMRLGELLVKAGIINERQLMDSVECALLEREQIGQILLRENLISPEELETALKLQEMVSSVHLKPTRAAEAMAIVRKNGLSVSEAIARATALERENGESIALYTFIGLAGIVSRQDLEAVGALGETDVSALAQKLIGSTKLTDKLFRDCQRLHTLVCEGMLTLERAIVALKHCQSNNRSAKLSLEDFGWPIG